ncbi:MAG: hypothetical protein QXU45_00755 [Candidatus Bathyarchaeia archaeon]
MRKMSSHLKSPHARYAPEENGFICLVCERHGFKKWIYEPWEIPKHLKAQHKIARKNQVILGWNKTFENLYLKNRMTPSRYIYDDEERGIFIYDIEFEGKRYRKEQFVYNPLAEPKKRMRYCSAFYNLWVREKELKEAISSGRIL